MFRACTFACKKIQFYVKKRKKMGHRLNLFKGFLMPNVKIYDSSSADTHTFFYKKFMHIY